MQLGTRALVVLLVIVRSKLVLVKSIRADKYNELKSPWLMVTRFPSTLVQWQ